MKQRSQIGKYIRKEDVLNAKTGREFVTPNNKSYTFNYSKEGAKYTFIITYKGHNMRISESDFNRTPIDSLLQTMEQGLQIV